VLNTTKFIAMEEKKGVGERVSCSPHGALSPPNGCPAPLTPSGQGVYSEIQRLRSEGLTVREIAQRLNLRFSEVKRLLGSEVEEVGDVDILIDGFDGIDFMTSSEPHGSSLDVTIVADLDDLSTVEYSWDLSNMFLPHHDKVCHTHDGDISPETPRGYLDHITKITSCQGGGVEWVVKEVEDVINWHAVNKPILDELFEVEGYSCVYRAKGRRSLRAIADLVRGWAVLDFDFTKIECHPVYYDLMKALGYPEGDLFVWFKLAKYKCSSCGSEIFKTHVSRSATAGRVHPVQLLSRCKKRAFLDYKRFLAVVHALLRHGVFNYRDGRFVRVYDKSLSLICLDLTVPKSVSLSLRDLIFQRLNEVMERYGFDLVGKVRDKHVLNAIYGVVFADIVKAMKIAFVRAYTDVVRVILENEEGLKVKGKIMFGGKVNCHIWSSGWLVPHFHLHTNFLNVVRVEVDGEVRYIRFKPKLSEWALNLLKEKWTKYLKEELFKIDDFRVWGYEIDFEDEFVVHSQFIELDLNENGDFKNAGKILHRLRYVSRSPLLDLNIALHDGKIVFENGEVYAVKDGQRIPIDFRWLMALALYQNRSQSFGFVHSCKKLLGVTDDQLKPYRGESRKEYCPFCGSELEFVDYLTMMDFLKEGNPFIITFYHNGYRRFEFWKKKGRGG